MAFVLYVLAVYDQPAKMPKDKVQIKFMCEVAPSFSATFDKLIAEFESQHPNIEVKVLRMPFGKYYTKVQTMMVGRTCADVLLFSGKRVNAFKIKKTLLNMMPYAKRDNFPLNDFFKVGLTDAQMTPDSLYYLPLEGSGTVLAYNKTAFDQLGLAYPNDNWTWQDYRQAAIKLTRDTDNDGRLDQVGTNAGLWWAGMLPWIWANGGQLVNKEHTKCLLTEKPALEAMQFLIDLETKDKVTSRALGGSDESNIFKNFAMGRVAMFCDIAYGLRQVMDAQKTSDCQFEWDIALPPKGKKSYPIRYTSSGFVIWQGTKHPEEAWELMKFLMSKKYMKACCDAYYYTPARKSLGLSKEYLENKKTPYDEKVIIRSLERARPLDNIYSLRSLENDFRIAIDKTRLGLEDLKTAMQRVVKKADAALVPGKKRSSKEDLLYIVISIIVLVLGGILLSRIKKRKDK